VGLGAFISRLDRWAGRFNRWFGGTALAAGAEGPGRADGPPTIDPASMVAVLGEMEREREGEKQTEPRG
jgi:hypothetical protein